MLSTIFNQHYHKDEKRRTNLFQGISRVILTLSRTLLPVIGSFIVDDDGFLLLVNRPLTMQVHELENEGIPVNIPRHRTYPAVDSYVNALLSNHDARLRHEPNEVNDESDCKSQLSALVNARAAASQFFDDKFNTGPFLFSLTGLHPGNIIVDEAWNIRCIIDLEWASSLPLEFVRLPSWLTMQLHDVIDPETYNVYRDEFMNIFQDEELKCNQTENRSIRPLCKRVGNVGHSGISSPWKVLHASMRSSTNISTQNSRQVTSERTTRLSVGIGHQMLRSLSSRNSGKRRYMMTTSKMRTKVRSELQSIICPQPDYLLSYYNSWRTSIFLGYTQSRMQDPHLRIS